VILVTAVACLGLSAVIIYFTVAGKAQALRLIEAEAALVVFDEMAGAMMLLPLVMLLILAALFIEVLAKDLKKREKNQREIKTQKYLMYALFASVPTIIIAGWMINSSWHERLESAGYIHCEGSLLQLSKRFTNSDWVIDPRMCHDEDARVILIRSHGNTGFERASRHLEATYQTN